MAFEFLVLTAARSGEVRLATWDEIDWAERKWTVPAERMKAKREHQVPLAGRAIEVLREAEELADGSAELIFPGLRGKPLSDMVFTANVAAARNTGRCPRLSQQFQGLWD